MYAFGDEPVNAWIPIDIPKDLRLQFSRWLQQTQPGALLRVGPKCPQRIRWHADRGGRFWAHNAMFERTVLNGPAGRKIHFPRTKRNQWHCTMVQAKESGLPADLGKCGKALDCKHQKNEDGRGDMLRLTKPRKPSKLNPHDRWLPEFAPDKFFNLFVYCVDDVLAERDIHANTKPITKNERKIYLLDQKINDRGWMVDQKALEDVQYLVGTYKKRIVKKMISGFQNPVFQP